MAVGAAANGLAGHKNRGDATEIELNHNRVGLRLGWLGRNIRRLSC